MKTVAKIALEVINSSSGRLDYVEYLESLATSTDRRDKMVRYNFADGSRIIDAGGVLLGE